MWLVVLPEISTRMKKVITTYGIISGIITAGLMLVTMPLFENGTLDFDNGALIGYAGMVIALSLIFFGIRSFRDNQAGGNLAFGKAFLIGAAITLIASLFYAVAWEITYARSGEIFVQQWTDHELKGLREGGATESELQTAKDKWKDFGELYKNPIIRFGMTLTEILPIGLLISLLSAFLLRKKGPLPANTNNE